MDAFTYEELDADEKLHAKVSAMSFNEIVYAFNTSTNMSNEFIISQSFIGELQSLMDNPNCTCLDGMIEDINKRARELYLRHFE